jgi:hypothetical protein
VVKKFAWFVYFAVHLIRIASSPGAVHAGLATGAGDLFHPFSACFCPKAGQQRHFLRQQDIVIPSKAATHLWSFTKYFCAVASSLWDVLPPS